MVGRVKRLSIVPIVALILTACSGKGTNNLLGDAAHSADAQKVGATDARDVRDASPDTAIDGAVEAGIDAKADAPLCKLTAPYSTKDLDCNVCAEANCCIEVNACLASKDCDQGYVNCIIACALTEKDKAAYDKCATACAADYPAGEKLYVGLGLCVDAACATACAN